MKILTDFIETFYPNKCLCCGEIIEKRYSLCDYCKSDLKKNNLENLCTVCGYETENCVCKYHVYRFEKLITVYKNEGAAQKIYYAYKFDKRQHYVNFFVDDMVNAVNKLYNDVKFDLVCSVPRSKTLLGGKFNYDHCGYLAGCVAKKLNVEFSNNLLYCKSRKRKQHKLSIKNRLTNVNGKFDYNFRIDGNSVLLIDDIRTTGATLDECAKTLLYAGAEKVYCITLLGTEYKSKK